MRRRPRRGREAAPRSALSAAPVRRIRRGAAGRRPLAGQVAGDVGIKGQETSRIHQSPLVGPTKLITNVTRPTLTVYRPAADKNTGTAMLICPGGGYWDLYWELEGEEVAAWLNSLGHDRHHPQVPLPAAPGRRPRASRRSARSSTPSGPSAWSAAGPRSGASTRSGSAWSASRRAATSRWRPPPASPKRLYEPIDAVDEVSCRPDFAVLCYSGYLKAKDKDEIRPGLRIPADTPPIFLAHASDDNESYGGSDAENSAVMYLALKRAGVPAELHIYATGDHDFGVRQNEKLPSSWTRLCVSWLRSRDLLKPGPDP